MRKHMMLLEIAGVAAVALLAVLVIIFNNTAVDATQLQSEGVNPVMAVVAAVVATAVGIMIYVARHKDKKSM